jgi:hypothetical protein
VGGVGEGGGGGGKGQVHLCVLQCGGRRGAGGTQDDCRQLAQQHALTQVTYQARICSGAAPRL